VRGDLLDLVLTRITAVDLTVLLCTRHNIEVPKPVVFHHLLVIDLLADHSFHIVNPVLVTARLFANDNLRPV